MLRSMYFGFSALVLTTYVTSSALGWEWLGPIRGGKRTTRTYVPRGYLYYRTLGSSGSSGFHGGK